MQDIYLNIIYVLLVTRDKRRIRSRSEIIYYTRIFITEIYNIYKVYVL